jgi:hypothetical protein
VLITSFDFSLWRKPFIWDLRVSSLFSGVSVEIEELNDNFFGIKGLFRSPLSAINVLTLGMLILDFVSLLFLGGSLPDDRLLAFSFLKCNTSTDGYWPFLGDNLTLFTISTDHQPYDWLLSFTLLEIEFNLSSDISGWSLLKIIKLTKNT